MLREAFRSNNALVMQDLSFLQRGQQTGFILLLRVFVDRLAIHVEETVEFYNLSGCIERIRFVADADAYGRFLNFRICHLRGYRALPYQVVQFSFLRHTFYLGIFHIRRANGFVSLLSAFGFGGEMTRIYIALSHHVGNDRFAAVDRQFGQVDGVGTHIGYLSRFVQPLGYHHGLCYCKS